MNTRNLRAGLIGTLLGSSSGALTVEDGLGVTASAHLSAGDMVLIGDNRTLAAALNKILRNIGTLGVRRMVRVVNRKDTIKTGDFKRGWKHKRIKLGAKFNNAVVLVNAVEYARWVHQKRTPKSRTLVRVDVPDVVTEMGKELENDLDTILRPKLANALKADILKRAAAGRRTRR